MPHQVTASLVTGGRRFVLMARSGFREGGACTSLGRERPSSKQARNTCEMDPHFSGCQRLEFGTLFVIQDGGAGSRNG